MTDFLVKDKMCITVLTEHIVVEDVKCTEKNHDSRRQVGKMLETNLEVNETVTTRSGAITYGSRARGTAECSMNVGIVIITNAQQGVDRESTCTANQTQCDTG